MKGCRLKYKEDCDSHEKIRMAKALRQATTTMVGQIGYIQERYLTTGSSSNQDLICRILESHRGGIQGYRGPCYRQRAAE